MPGSEEGWPDWAATNLEKYKKQLEEEYPYPPLDYDPPVHVVAKTDQARAAANHLVHDNSVTPEMIEKGLREIMGDPEEKS